MTLNQCRLCLKIDNTAVCVFDQVEKNLSEKIKLCFGVVIKPDDPITKKICRCCYYFTNSAFEHRIASQENDITLKREYEGKVAIKVELQNEIDQNEITQNDFLNNLKLTNKDDMKISNVTVVHQSVKNLKRKYPNINIPDCCNILDLDPFVDVLSQPKKKYKNNTWSISNKKTTSDLIFTVVKTENTQKNSNNSKEHKKTLRRRRLSSTSSNCSNISNIKITRSAAKAFNMSSKNFDKDTSFSDVENVDKSPPKKFPCPKCKINYSLERNLKSHKCMAKNTPQKKVKEHSGSLKGFQPAANKFDNSKNISSENSENTTEKFKPPKKINVSPKKTNISPLSKIANSTQLKDANADLKTLLEINEKINDSISKSSKDNKGLVEILNNKVSQDVSKNKEQTIAITKENLSNSVKIPENTFVGIETLENSLENSKNDSLFNTSDLLVHGEEVRAFLCLTCNKVFDSLDLLKHHKKYAHKLSLRCDKCPKKFTVVESLMRHKKIHDNFERKREASAKAKVEKMMLDEMKNNEESNASTVVTSNEDTSSEAPSKSEETMISTVVSDSPEKEEHKNLATSTIKRAANLPQLSVTLEPLEYVGREIKDTSQLTRGRMVARKQTSGALFLSNSDESHNISSDSDSSLSSSDEDDCKITEVFTKNIAKKNDTTFVAIRPEKLFLDTALTPQSSSETEKTPSKVETEIKPVITDSNYVFNEVFVIDSDSDTEVSQKAVDKNNADQNKTTKENSSTSNIKDKPIENNCPDSSSSTVLPGNLEEGSFASVSASASVTFPETSNNTKIANELNYINYLYNKCSYDEKSVTNGSQYWTLQHLKQIVKNTIVPIEINKILDQYISIKYTTTNPKPKPAIPLIPWNYTKAIDLNVGVNNKTSKSKQTNQQIAKNQKASIKVPIPASVKPKVVNGSKSNQFTTKYVPSETTTSSQNQKKANSKNQSNKVVKPPVHYIIGPNLQQSQPIQANIIQNQQIQANIIQSQQIQANTTQSQQIQANITQSQQIQANTTQSQQIQANTIQSQQIQANVIQSQQIQKTSVQTQQIQTNTAENQQILTNTMQAQQIQANTMQAQQIQENTIQAQQQIQANTIQVQQQIQANTIQAQQQIQANTIQAQQIQANTLQVQQTQELLQSQNIPNKNAENSQARSLLKNALTTSPQPFLYTYLPSNTMPHQKYVTIPTTEAKQGMDQSFVINGVPFQSMTNINKNATIVIQQIDQPNFINITQPAFFATPENGNTPIYLNQQTNIVQENTVKQTEVTVNEATNTTEQEQMNEVSSSSLTQTDASHRPMIRIKSLSELTAKPSNSKDENSTYINVYANYVNTRQT